MQYYVNGSAVDDNPNRSTPSGSAVDDSSQDLYIGNNAGTERAFDGIIDEVRLYNRKLELAEIQKNYKHQKGKHKND